MRPRLYLRDQISSIRLFHRVDGRGNFTSEERSGGHVRPGGELAMLTAIVVMDIVMPKMDGIAATRLIKTTYPHFAIIGLTGDLKNYTLYSMKKAGAYEVVDKKNAVVKCM